MKSEDLLHATEELLAKSQTNQEINPEDVAYEQKPEGEDTKEDTKDNTPSDEPQAQEEPKEDTEQQEGDTEEEEDDVDKSEEDELTEEEKKALASGEYDYDPEATEEEEGEDDNEEIHKSLANLVALNRNMLNQSQSLVKSLGELQKDLSAKDELIKSLSGRIAELENSPVPRKSVSTYMEKSFSTSAGFTADGVESLSKSEHANILTEALIKGETSITPIDVVNAEQGVLSEAARAIVAKYSK